MIITLKAIILSLILAMSGGNTYSVWMDNGLHLIMADNGTPEDYSDDWVVDYETNRDVIVIVCD